VNTFARRRVKTLPHTSLSGAEDVRLTAFQFILLRCHSERFRPVSVHRAKVFRGEVKRDLSHRKMAGLTSEIRALPSVVLAPLDKHPCSGQRRAPRFVLMAVSM
jgi:hypothetical protein